MGTDYVLLRHNVWDPKVLAEIHAEGLRNMSTLVRTGADIPKDMRKRYDDRSDFGNDPDRIYFRPVWSYEFSEHLVVSPYSVIVAVKPESTNTFNAEKRVEFDDSLSVEGLTNDYLNTSIPIMEYIHKVESLPEGYDLNQYGQHMSRDRSWCKLYDGECIVDTDIISPEFFVQFDDVSDNGLEEDVFNWKPRRRA